MLGVDRQVMWSSEPDAENCTALESCPIAATLAVVGGKWKPMILYLISTGENRFGKLRRGIAGVSRKVLTQHLRELEADGLIKRTEYPEVPPRVEYHLTPKGDTLKPLLAMLYDWGRNHLLGA